jgi:hypothetical protein
VSATSNCRQRNRAKTLIAAARLVGQSISRMTYWWDLDVVEQSAEVIVHLLETSFRFAHKSLVWMLAAAATKQSLKTALKTLRISVDPTAQVNPRFLDQLIRSRFLRRSRKWLLLSGKQTCEAALSISIIRSLPAIPSSSVPIPP